MDCLTCTDRLATCTVFFPILQSHEYRTSISGNSMYYTMMVTGDGVEDQVEFALDDENVTHVVISSYNNGSLAFTQVRT